MGLWYLSRMRKGAIQTPMLTHPAEPDHPVSTFWSEALSTYINCVCDEGRL